MCAVTPGSISSAVKSKWKTASSAPNTRVLSPVIGSSEDPGYSDLEPSPWIYLSLMPLLCVFSHPRPRLSEFIPAQLASSLARSWGRDREHSEPIFAPPPTWSSPSQGGDRPLSHTANSSITKWKGCLGKMGLAAARWGKAGRGSCSVWAAAWEDVAFLWSLEGWTTLKQRRPSLGDGKSAGPSPPACHVCFAASLWLSVGPTPVLF